MPKTPAEGLHDYNFPGIKGKAVKPCDHTGKPLDGCSCLSCVSWRKFKENHQAVRHMTRFWGWCWLFYFLLMPIVLWRFVVWLLP